jgi:hypothetical protein
MPKPFAVRKLNTDEPWWYVVDLRVPRAALLDPAAVVAKVRDRNTAKEHAAKLNARSSDA